MRRTPARGAGIVLAILGASPALAAPVLDAGYGDDMVLQQGRVLTLSGRAVPGAAVTARLGEAGASAVADAAGAFSITLPAQPRSTAPQTLVISDRTGAATYANILIGNVFLCGGQSNMALPVIRALDADNQLRAATDNAIRLLMVPQATAAVPQAAFAAPARWHAATAETAAPFSAACFHMAKALRQRDPATPVGLIHANWGGSAARVWLDPESASAREGPLALDLLRLHAHDVYAATQAFAPQWFAWWRAHDGGREPWRTPGILAWQPIPKFSLWNEWTGTGLDTEPRGTLWLRTTLTLTPERARGEGRLAIGAMDDMDMTFVNGHPVGYTFGWGTERTYRVPPQHLRGGQNTILIAATNMWGTGGFFAGPERLAFTAANGDTVPLGLRWDYAPSGRAAFPPRAPWDASAWLGVMHNAMIAPLGRMPIAAVAWYQGETDVGQPGYDAMLAALAAGWRRQFGAETRMLVVQLADWGERRSVPGESAWAQLRDEQRRAVAADANAALVTAIDIGEPTDIHPANKTVLGQRLAAAFDARAMPSPERATREGPRVTVRFAGIAGALQVQGGPTALGAELCEAGPGTCRFVLAHAEGNRLALTVPQGMTPTRVRYAWADAPVVNLVDGEGMPVPGFELLIER